LIHEFYTSFQNGNAKAMGDLYAENATFEDPAFGLLDAAHTRAMWAMLVKSGGENLKIIFRVVEEDEHRAVAEWKAKYLFSKTNRLVINDIRSTFTIENGKIVKQVDQFNFWKWTTMALGITGWFLGWTSMVKNKVRTQALSNLAKFMKG
jgi:ketosteroid isomerase-like protein